MNRGYAARDWKTAFELSNDNTLVYWAQQVEGEFGASGLLQLADDVDTLAELGGPIADYWASTTSDVTSGDDSCTSSGSFTT